VTTDTCRENEETKTISLKEGIIKIKLVGRKAKGEVKFNIDEN